MKVLIALLPFLVLAAAPAAAWGQEEKQEMHQRQKDVERGLSWRVALLWRNDGQPVSLGGIR